MSFTTDAKKEILNAVCENECCKMAQLSAIIHSAGELSIKNGQTFIQIKTDIKDIYNIVNDSLKRLYGEQADIEEDEETNINKTTRYLINIPANCSRQVLFDCGLAKINSEGIFELIQGIDEHIIESPCCAVSYIKGVFLTSSTSNIIINKELERPVRTFSGYQLEFVFANEVFAKDFSALLFSQGINSKKTHRKKVFVLYIKEAEQISDLLALIGAFKGVLTLQNEITLRQVRNMVNRQNNCINANITKTVNASMKQLDAINKIKNKQGLETLPESLREICQLRLDNPEESLENLTKLTKEPITKSGINHKFRKIMSIAKDIK